MPTIYVLKLECGKYYIGRTNKKVIERFKEHKMGNGSAWTRKYKPIGIDKIDLDEDKFEEDKVTKQYMEKYGIDNVRGGTYCKLVLSNEIKEMISKELNGGTGKCYNCGKAGHYIQNCPLKTQVWCCNYCSMEFPTYKDAAFHERFHCKKKQKHCTRCNRDGHTVGQCYAKTKISTRPKSRRRKQRGSSGKFASHLVEKCL